MNDRHALVMLFDVDNTLLDNDLVRRGLEQRLTQELGDLPAKRFWNIYENVRLETELVDFPLTIARWRLEFPSHPQVTRLEYLIFGFDFASVVYAESPAAVAHAHAISRPVVLSDGDQNFQRHKVRAAGIEAAFDGHVLIYVHKELNTHEIMMRYPAEHYAMIDDKPRIHTAMKERLGAMVTTVHVCQGKYAHDPSHHQGNGADVTIEGIGDLMNWSREALVAAGRGS